MRVGALMSSSDDAKMSVGCPAGPDVLTKLMETQPAGQFGCEKAEIGDRCVSSGKLNVGAEQGDGQTPDVTVFSSSS